MEIDWNNLSFGYTPVKSHIQYSYRDGAWNDGALINEPFINISVAATCLHYGQACFEGLKAYRCKDGRVRIFRPEENSKRLNKTLATLMAPLVPEEMFMTAVSRVIKDNIDYVPPYGTGGALYIRPLVIGTSAQIGISPSENYEFIVIPVPVGSYYKNGIKPVTAMLMDEFDRAAPSGTGSIKVAGNYAAGLYPRGVAREKGAQVALFLDPREHKYIDEFGTSNFIGITPDRKYVTPDSGSILRSVTNMSLMRIAEDSGIPVEKRKIPREELGSFSEVGACGTAVVITPIEKIIHDGGIYNYGSEIGPVLKELYDKMTGIQFGELPDTHNWLTEL